MFKDHQPIGETNVHDLRWKDIIHDWINDKYYTVLYSVKKNTDQYVVCISPQDEPDTKGREVTLRWNDHFMTYRPIEQ